MSVKKKKNLRLLAKQHNINYATLQNRYYVLKWDLERALNTPIQGSRTLEQLFHERYEIDENGCWKWTAYIGPDGYGRLYHPNDDGSRAYTSAHVYSKILHTGQEIPEGKMVCHRCDVKDCVNPHHLYIGTHQDNVADALARNRYCRGEDKPNTHLTDDDIRYIRKSGLPNKELAAMFNVHPSTISKIISFVVWKHVR